MRDERDLIKKMEQSVQTIEKAGVGRAGSDKKNGEGALS